MTDTSRIEGLLATLNAVDVGSLEAIAKKMDEVQRDLESLGEPGLAGAAAQAIEALRQRWHGRAKVDAILANRMYEACIREGKPLPDFTHTDEWQVSVALHGQIVDEYFVKFLAHIGRETKQSFGLQDFLVFDLVHREQMVPAHLRPTLRRLR